MMIGFVNTSWSHFKRYNFGEGLQISQEQGKKIIVFAYADWCQRSRRMMEETYNNSDVAFLIEKRFIFVALNIESTQQYEFNGNRYSEAEIAKLLGVRSTPATIFMEPGGPKIDLWDDFINPDEFLRVMIYYSEGHYHGMQYVLWKSQFKSKSGGDSQASSTGGDQLVSTYPRWRTFSDGMSEVLRNGKKGIIEIYLNSNNLCKRMEDETFSDPQVQRALDERFVAIKLDAESNREQVYNGIKTTERLLAGSISHIDFYPTFIFVDGKGARINMIEGFLDSQKFIDYLNYVSDDYYRKMSFGDYRQKVYGGN